MKKFILIFVFIVALMALAACGSGARDFSPEFERTLTSREAFSFDGSVSSFYGVAEASLSVNAAPMPPAPGVTTQRATNAQPIPEERRIERIIRTGHVHLQTEYFDEQVEQLRVIAPAVGGFIEHSELSPPRSWMPREVGRSFNITLRVPQEHFNEIFHQVESMAHLVFSTQSAEDVTAQYYNILSRLETRRIEEERVLSLIEAVENIQELLALEGRLAGIRTQIALYEAQLTRMNDLATFSTIHVELWEITDGSAAIIAGDTFWGRISGAFTNSINHAANAMVFFVGLIIPLAAIALVIFAGVATSRVVRKKEKRNPNAA